MKRRRLWSLGLRVAARFRGLQGRIMALVGTVFALLMLLVFTSVGVYVYQMEGEAWRGRQVEAARNAAQTVSAFLQRNEDALQWADLFEVDEPPGTSQSGVDVILRENSALLEIAHLDSSGAVLADAAVGPAVLENLFTIPQSEWFLAARSGRKYYTPVQISAEGEPYLIYAQPTHDGHVMAARIKMDVLWEVVSNLRFGRGGSAFVIASSGRVIAHTDWNVVLAAATLAGRSELPAIWQAPGREWYGSRRDFDGREVVSVSTPIQGTDWIVITDLPQSEAYASSRALLTVLPLGVLAVATVVLVVFRQNLHAILRSVDILRTGALRLGQGDLSYRIPEWRGDELGEVMAVFNAMGNQLEKQQTALERRAAENAQLLEQATAELAERRRAEEALRALNEELESRVAARTQELTRLNADLVRENDDRRRAEEQVRTSLREKEVLIKEIHHRVKNNLQVISSLLALQSKQTRGNAQAEAALAESQQRVRSMALIHEKLYQSQNLAEVDLADYVKHLATYMVRTYRPGAIVDLKLNLDAVALDVDLAVPCGLVLNELISNALKYAFTGRERGTLWVELHSAPGQGVTLRVADDGCGLPAGLDIYQTPSLGLQLVTSLVGQLRGKVEVDSARGAEFRIAFPCPA